MKLTVLGSGTMMPTKKRYPSGYLLDAGSTRVLLDCSAPAIARLVDHGVPFREIEALCITHFHTDHFGGFLPFVHALWVDNLMTKRQASPLTVLGPRTTEERWKKLREVSWPEPETFPLTFIEGPATTSLGSLTIESFDVKHVPFFSSLGYRLTSGGKTLVYTGDIGSDHPFDDLVGRVQGADVLLIEAGATKPSPNHFTIEQILKLQEVSGVKRIIATHIREQNLPLIQSKVAGQHAVTIAEDGMTVEI